MAVGSRSVLHQGRKSTLGRWDGTYRLAFLFLKAPVAKNRAEQQRQAHEADESHFQVFPRWNAWLFAIPMDVPHQGLSVKVDDLGIEFANLRHPVKDSLDQFLGIGHRGIGAQDA